MSTDSPNRNLKEMRDLQEGDGSTLVRELDLNLDVSKEGIDGYDLKYEASGDRIQMDLNKQDGHGSILLPAEDRFEISESPYTKSSSPVKPHLDHDEEKNKNDHDRDEMQAYPGNTEMTTGFLGNSTSLVEAGAFHSEMEGEDLPHCPGMLSAAEGNSLEDKDNLPSQNDELKENSGKILGNLQYKEKGHVYEEMTDGGVDHLKGRQYDAGETKDELTYYSRESPLNDENLEKRNSDPRSPGRTPRRSASPLRQMSVSPQRSPCMLQSAGRELSSPQGERNMSDSPSTRQKISPSPRRRGEDNERVRSPEQLPVSGRRTSTSPRRRPRHDSPRKDESTRKRSPASPRRRHSPSDRDRRRQDRFSSRSPTRRNDSSVGNRRVYRDRSRSRSPYGRDRYRRSPRGRYSPRRRSPPSRHHSRRHSPRRRPWSPPPNRSTGIGRPGKNLFVAGFSFVTTERDLERKFSRFGRVRDVRIVRDKRSGDSRGFGFLSLERDEDADAAIRALDQTEWNGRVVLVEKSKAPAG